MHIQELEVFVVSIHEANREIQLCKFLKYCVVIWVSPNEAEISAYYNGVIRIEVIFCEPVHEFIKLAVGVACNVNHIVVPFVE